MTNQLLMDVQNLIQNIDINSFDWVFYLTYNPELVFIGIHDQSSAQHYFSQQSGQQITNQNLFFQVFQRSLVDSSTPPTKFDPAFYSSYYQISHLVSPIDIASYWLLYGYHNNQNVLSEKSLIFYQQMDIDKIIHNTQTSNTPQYLVSNILKSSNDSTQDFINNLLTNSPSTSTNKQQNLVIYLNEQLSNHFSSLKTHIDSYINSSLQSSIDNYKQFCDSYFQSKSDQFISLFKSSSTQYQQLNLDKINLFQDQNFQSILNLQNQLHDIQQQLSQLNSASLKNNLNSSSIQYKDLSLYIKHIQSQQNLDLQNNSTKKSYQQ